jgi:hypothetical protein
MSYQNDPTTLAGGANGQTPLAGFVQGSLPSFASAGANLLYAYNLPGNRFANAIAGSAFRLPSKSFSLASDAPVIQERFKDVQLTADHRIGDLYLQVAADLNRANQRINNIDVRNSNVMYIDINKVLPNGAPNTHFLQPYADGILRRNLNYRNSQGARFAAGYVKDAGKWGNFTFNAMGGVSVNEYLNQAENLTIAQNADHRRWGATGVALGETDRIRVRRYWNESSRGYYEPTSIRFIDPVNNIDKTINPFWALENDRNDSQQYTKTRFTYGIASVNAKFFKNRLIVLGAVRGDDFYNYNKPADSRRRLRSRRVERQNRELETRRPAPTGARSPTSRKPPTASPPVPPCPPIRARATAAATASRNTRTTNSRTTTTRPP